MRIAQVAPLYVATPPVTYGGTERVISGLTETLVKKGHDVTLFATGDSKTSANLVACAPRALGFKHLYEAGATHIAMMAEVYRRARDFDVIHSHADYYTLPFVADSPTPTVITLHGALDAPSYPGALQAYPNVPYVSISNSQRRPLPMLNYVSTIYHGVDVTSHPFKRQHGSYLLFVGRISAEKGPDRAIEVAKRCGIPLKIAAKIDPKDQEFFEQTIKPELENPLIEYLGAVDEQRKRALMVDALALILPIRWAEPFGMVYIEALACGAPVITCPIGSTLELVRDGETGFLCETDDELVEAVERVHTISRRACRNEAMARFDLNRMAADYLDVYERLIHSRARRAVHPSVTVDPLTLPVVAPARQRSRVGVTLPVELAAALPDVVSADTVSVNTVSVDTVSVDTALASRTVAQAPDAANPSGAEEDLTLGALVSELSAEDLASSQQTY